MVSTDFVNHDRTKEALQLCHFCPAGVKAACPFTIYASHVFLYLTGESVRWIESRQKESNKPRKNRLPLVRGSLLYHLKGLPLWSNRLLQI